MMHEYHHYIDYAATDRVNYHFPPTCHSHQPVREISTPNTTRLNVTSVTPRRSKLDPQSLLAQNGKPYKCDKCEYSSSLKSNLNQHVTCVHALEKPFKCTLCNYAASIKSNLNQHIRCVHAKTKPFKCSQCEYAASIKSNLNQH